MRVLWTLEVRQGVRWVLVHSARTLGEARYCRDNVYAKGASSIRKWKPA